MSRYYDEDQQEAADKWEHEHEHRLRWKCPKCDYEYESERNRNEALECPEHGCKTVNIGEIYL